MSFAEHFSVIDDTLSPQPWMQLRQVASATEISTTKSYATSGGGNKNDLVQSLQTQWTNNTPIQQWCYGTVTRCGAQVTLQSRSRGYLATYHGVEVSALSESILMDEVSRFGVGAETGLGGTLALGSAFSTAEIRSNSVTVPLMPHVTGWFLVNPGEKFNARVELRFVSEFWENTAIDGGDSATESYFITGDTRLDLYAVPIAAAPLTRLTPQVVGLASDVEINIIFDGTSTIVDVPAGLAAGDVLIAVVANQLGLSSDITYDTGAWTLLHACNEGAGGWEDVHMRILLHTVTNPSTEPATYSFGNGLLAEEIAVIIALRNAAPLDAATGVNWFAASNLSRWKFVEDQIAPSVSLSTQKLICVSYFAHALPQAPINQAPPPGMTELVDIAAGASTLAIAFLDLPPTPTGTRKFTPTKIPIFSGHSITAAILVPGELV